MMYCSLIFASNTSDPIASAFSDAMIRAGTESGQHLAFLDIELGEKMLSHPSLVSDPALSSYRHYLERVIRSAPHNLTEIEEKLILAKDQYGVIKWSKLHQRWLSSRTFRMTLDGEEKDLSLGEMMAFVTDPDREKRLHAYQVLGKVVAESDTIWTDSLSSICGDHLEMCQWRKYPTPMSSSLLFNDVEEKAIRAMMRVVEDHVPMCKEYYDLKAKLLDLERCGDWDMLAPLGTEGRKFTWEESRERMISAYSRFDPSWGRWVSSMFSDRRIDSEVRKGKRNGAFCSDWYAGKGAFILMSFNGSIHDLYTEAHELGHSVHAHLSIERQNPSNCNVSFCVAECGSIFGELLLTDLLLQEAKNDQDRQAALASVLDTFAYILFHVGARYVFEDSLYQTLQAGKNLDAAKTCQMWTSARSRMMGDSMTWLPESDWTWARVPHFFRTGLRFYNYPYIFAQLFVFSLYRLYKEQGEAFVPKMNALLAQGSSLSATDLAGQLGFDLENEEFWEKGIVQAEEFLQQLKATMR
jgi:oligoendopeptidase F